MLSTSPKCMTFPAAWHGDSQEAAVANVRDAIQLSTDTAREFGDPIPEPGDFEPGSA